MTTTAPAQANPRRELQLLLKSHFTAVFVETVEEARAEELMVDVARSCNKSIYFWSNTRGLALHGDNTLHEESLQPKDALRDIERIGGDGVFVMRDLGHYLDDQIVRRQLLDISRAGAQTIVIIGSHVELPDALRIHSAVYVLPKPDLVLLDTRARTMIETLTRRGMANELTTEQFATLVQALRGLTLEEVDQVVSRLVIDDGRLTIDDIAGAVQAKGELLARGGIVELTTPTHGLEWVAGFTEFKKWADARGKAFRPDAQQFGLTAPRGVLLTGVPGCGKSMVVKALAHEWNMPLLRLDAGALFDKFIGSTEKNLREALKTAEALAPSMLWIDEIEKGFATTGPSESDGGLGFRLIGMLATWMQERKQPVFVAATSNNMTILPPELTRQGRFDEIFFVDLPLDDEREHLFRIQLARRNRDFKLFDCAAMAEAADGFSGSEIEQSIVNALYTAYADGREVDSAHVLAEIGKTRPLLVVSPDKIEAIREWGEVHARKA